MTWKDEVIAIINTHAYFIAKKVFDEKQKEIDTLEKENKHLRTELTRTRNKSKGMSKSLVEEENKRLRSQNQQLIKERNMWQRKCRDLRGLK